MNKLLAVALVAIGVIAIGGYTFPHVQQTEAPQTLGSITGPDSVYEYESVNGVATYYYSSGLNRASTTICSFKTPPATTTLSFASAMARVGTTSVIAVEFGRSTVPDATTTSLGIMPVASGAQWATVASTSQGKIDSAQIFPPSTFLNVKYGGTLGALNVFVGSCKAQFVVN